MKIIQIIDEKSFFGSTSGIIGLGDDGLTYWLDSRPMKLTWENFKARWRGELSTKYWKKM